METLTMWWESLGEWRWFIPSVVFSVILWRIGSYINYKHVLKQIPTSSFAVKTESRSHYRFSSLDEAGCRTVVRFKGGERNILPFDNCRVIGPCEQGLLGVTIINASGLPRLGKCLALDVDNSQKTFSTTRVKKVWLT